MKIFELFGSIMVDNDKANKSISKTESKAKQMAKSLGGGIKTAAKWSGAIVGGAAAVGGAMLAAGSKFADTTDRIDKLSQKLGMSRKGFQEWDYILSQSGTNIEQLKGGMKKLTVSFDDLKSGGKISTEAFARLGLTLDDLKGKTQEEIFETTVKALQGVTDESERAAIANDLLGKSGQELAPLLNAGAGSIENMKKQAGDLGLIIGDDAIDAGVKFTDTLDQVKRTLKGLAIILMSGLMPILQKALEFVQQQMPLIQDILKNVFSTLSTILSSVMPFLRDCK